MGCATIDIMMLRATVVDVNPRDPTRVWVTIPQKYGAKPLRVFTRVQVTKGDHVYVTNTSVTRVPQWVVFDQQTEVGTWGNPYPHTHPIGQVDGLVDWVKEYEAWAKDHAARLDAADKRIAEGKAEVDAARKDLTQAQTDIAEAVRKAALERARLDAAEARLDQTNRDLLAAGTRIGANETALAGAQKRLESAETIVEKTTADLGVLEGTVGDVSAKAEASEQKALEALNRAGTAQAAADGKTTITRALEPRTTQPGTAVGDTHFTMSSMGGGGQVLRQQRWDGSIWQDEALSHQVIASLDLGKATVGNSTVGASRPGRSSPTGWWCPRGEPYPGPDILERRHDGGPHGGHRVETVVTGRWCAGAHHELDHPSRCGAHWRPGRVVPGGSGGDVPAADDRVRP